MLGFLLYHLLSLSLSLFVILLLFLRLLSRLHFLLNDTTSERERELLQDYADPTSLPPFSFTIPAREANFYAKRSSPEDKCWLAALHFQGRSIA